MQVEPTFEDEYYDLPGLSVYCKICPSTLRGHIKTDGLPAYKVRGKILVKRSEFDRWLGRFSVGKKQDLDAIADEAIEDLRNGKSD